MKMNLRLVTLHIAGFLCSLFAPNLCGEEAPVSPRVSADASAPSPRTGNKHFFDRHESFLRRGQAGPIGVVFLGDSITERWKNAPHIWEHYFGRYQPANFGIDGDLTQNVPWRIENGELDGITPKVIVLMIGTNNSASSSSEQIADAVKKILETIRVKLPESKVLLLAIFPRGPRTGKNGGPDPWERRMTIINAANHKLAELDDGMQVRFLDINQCFLGNDRTIPAGIMPDQLHLKWTPKVGQRGTVSINQKGTVQHVQETTPA